MRFDARVRACHHEGIQGYQAVELGDRSFDPFMEKYGNLRRQDSGRRPDSKAAKVPLRLFLHKMLELHVDHELESNGDNLRHI